jgi:hypothetical protein
MASRAMSHSSPSFQLLDSHHDSRADQVGSLRTLFVLLIVTLIVLGMVIGITLFRLIRLHYFDWTPGLIVLSNALGAFVLARIIYRQLPR